MNNPVYTYITHRYVNPTYMCWRVSNLREHVGGLGYLRYILYAWCEMTVTDEARGTSWMNGMNRARKSNCPHWEELEQWFPKGRESKAASPLGMVLYINSSPPEEDMSDRLTERVPTSLYIKIAIDLPSSRIIYRQSQVPKRRIYLSWKWMVTTNRRKERQSQKRPVVIREGH